MTRYSLRLRLLMGGAIAVFAALAVAWLLMMLLFERHIERRVEDELRRYALQLIAELVFDESGTITITKKPLDLRFQVPISGLYWQVSTKTETERSRSLWDESLPPSPQATTDNWITRIVDGPFNRSIFLLERVIHPNNNSDVVLVQVGYDEKGIKLARTEFGQELAVFLIFLWLILLCAAWIQVHLGLKPLAIIRSNLITLHRNPAERLDTTYPTEIQPLADAINGLAKAREDDLTRARQRAADLAHGMKTPLAALTAQARLLRESGIPTDGLEQAINAAAAAVETELTRARAATARSILQTAEAYPLTITQRLISVLERTEKGMRIDYQIDFQDAFRIKMSTEDLQEILGTLLENAVKFARRRVQISGTEDSNNSYIVIEDDGPGIADHRAAEALTRGTRLDQIGNGHGLGLAIARDLVDATGGTISLSSSDLGGLCVKLAWPKV